MKAHYLYLKYVLRHKWFVFVACLQYGLIWRGIKHDWTKFLPSEWFPYANHDFTKDEPDPAFDVAWNHHQKRNSHHWQYWLLRNDKPMPRFNWQAYGDEPFYPSYIVKGALNRPAAIVYDPDLPSFRPSTELVLDLVTDLKNTPIALKMPTADMKEMLCDWIGAGKAKGKPNTWEWYEANKDNMQLHPETRAWIEVELAKQKEYHEQYEKMRGMGIIS